MFFFVFSNEFVPMNVFSTHFSFFFKQKHKEKYQQYVNEKQMKRGRPKNTQTLSETVLTQKSLDIAVTKLIVKNFLPVSLADDEHFREYSWGMFIV